MKPFMSPEKTAKSDKCPQVTSLESDYQILQLVGSEDYMFENKK